MKKLFQRFFMLIAVCLLCGCATNGEYETRLRPPDAFNPIFYRYKQLEGQKVMVVAVDPDGSWAFGYDHGRATPEEAAENASLKCDKAREKFKVFTKAKLFAVNDDVVYYDAQFE